MALERTHERASKCANVNRAKQLVCKKKRNGEDESGKKKELHSGRNRGKRGTGKEEDEENIHETRTTQTDEFQSLGAKDPARESFPSGVDLGMRSARALLST